MIVPMDAELLGNLFQDVSSQSTRRLEFGVEVLPLIYRSRADIDTLHGLHRMCQWYTVMAFRSACSKLIGRKRAWLQRALSPSHGSEWHIFTGLLPKRNLAMFVRLIIFSEQNSRQIALRTGSVASWRSPRSEDVARVANSKSTSTESTPLLAPGKRSWTSFGISYRNPVDISARRTCCPASLEVFHHDLAVAERGRSARQFRRLACEVGR